MLNVKLEENSEDKAKEKIKSKLVLNKFYSMH